MASVPFQTSGKHIVTYEAVVQWRGEFLEIEPDVECARRGDFYIEMQFVEALEDMITFGLEVLLQCDLFHNPSGQGKAQRMSIGKTRLFLGDARGLEQRNCSQLHSIIASG